MTRINNKEKIAYIIAGAISAIVLPALMGYTKSDKFNVPHSQIPYCIVSPELPTETEFAGEKIGLTRQDRRERLDREILAFTYSHINTLLQIKRANRLFPIVEPILKECNVPDDFKYLMIIESNGDIYARSAVGAAGLWQFMEKTAQQYGLEVNSYVDERYHIEKATRAACEYLKESYNIYGDWLTVAASYNAGRNSINKRIENQKEQKAINLQLVPETSRYIFRLLAVKNIFENPVKFGFIIQNRDLYPPLPIVKTIAIKKPVKCWAAMAKKHGLSFMQLREANPWIRSTELPNKNGNTYMVAIPDSAGLHYNPENTKTHNKKWVIK
ncbi:MAG: lytic transglycosylase domain-containing protein [Bacteroidaceae bacterium]|nr:lytic transglycosylase domain-containing protein [Bacteroidaceae bacterium]